MKKEKLNKTKLSEWFQVSRSTPSDWQARGAPIRASGSDPREVARWLVKQRPNMTVSGERSKLLSVQTRRQELQLKIDEGSYHSVEGCKRAAFNCGRAIRDRVLQVPDRLDAVLAAEDDRGRVNDALKNELIAVFRDFSDS